MQAKLDSDSVAGVETDSYIPPGLGKSIVTFGERRHPELITLEICIEVYSDRFEELGGLGGVHQTILNALVRHAT